MRRTALFAAVMLLGAAPLSAAEGPVHTIVNVDVMPSHEAEGAQILKAYAAQARHDPAVRSVMLIRQLAPTNHFILDTSFADEATYRRFVESEAFRAFRSQLYPHLGSPWDERIGRDQ
ncbi:putative quinol monooxygenase [Novosphingobium terrae]|uniref:putative quinol monooxygenase n=1 Tax=Novosphingobium terrae TaxID=2726189 RepID=UPI00389992A6